MPLRKGDLMKRFLIFWDSGNDQELVAQSYAAEARAHAKQINKPIQTKVVDVSKSDPDKQYWDQPDTIECVTVDDTTKKETALRPQNSDIDLMVDNL